MFYNILKITALLNVPTSNVLFQNTTILFREIPVFFRISSRSNDLSKRRVILVQ